MLNLVALPPCPEFGWLQASLNRRSASRARIEPVNALVTDIDRQRVPGVVLNTSPGGIGLKVDDPFPTNFPVLLECDGLLIVGEVRHCKKASEGGYLLGLKIQRVAEAAPEKTKATKLGGRTWRPWLPLLG